MTTSGFPASRTEKQIAFTKLAGRQHGAISRQQLVHIGVSGRTIERWASTGRLRRIHSNSYAVPGSPETERQRLMGAVLASQPQSLASHRAAAWLWGLSDAPFLEVTVARSRRPRLRGVVVHHLRDHGKARPSIKDGIPVTDPLRTLADLGAVWDREMVSDAVEQALIRRLVTFRGLVSEWRRVAKPGRNGSGVLRQILEYRLLGEKPADSLLEPKAAPLFRKVGGRLPEFQYDVVDGGRFVARVDFAYVDLRVAIEFDGLSAHGTAAALQSDLRRQNALVAAGWIVLRFTWWDVVHRADAVAAEIRGVLRIKSRAA